MVRFVKGPSAFALNAMYQAQADHKEIVVETRTRVSRQLTGG